MILPVRLGLSRLVLVVIISGFKGKWSRMEAQTPMRSLIVGAWEWAALEGVSSGGEGPRRLDRSLEHDCALALHRRQGRFLSVVKSGIAAEWRTGVKVGSKGVAKGKGGPWGPYGVGSGGRSRGMQGFAEEAGVGVWR